MKTRTIAPLVLLLLIAVSCTNLFTGIVTFRDVRDVALKDWAQASHEGKTTKALDDAVIAQDKHVQEAAKVAQDALETFQANGDKAAYIKALSVLQVAVSDLVSIVVPVITDGQATSLKTLQAKASKP